MATNTASSSAQSTEADAEVRATIERWAEAVRTKDVPGILRNHDANVLIFDVRPPVQRKGLEAYKGAWDLFFSWSHDPVVFEIVEMTSTVGDGVAFVAALIRCAGTEPGGEEETLTVRVTIGLRKLAGHWTVWHEHHSVPAR